MKKTKLRRQSKNPRKVAQRNADRALQDAYRRAYPNEKCEVCGEQFNLMHHHILKSDSNYTRFLQPANLVFLCNHCHSKIHLGNNYDVVTEYSDSRGDEWKRWIKEARKERISLGIPRLMEIKEYYDNNVPEKYEGNT